MPVLIKCWCKCFVHVATTASKYTALNVLNNSGMEEFQKTCGMADRQLILNSKEQNTVACHSDPGDCDLSDNAAGFSTPLDMIRIVCIPPEHPRTSQTWTKPEKTLAASLH